MVVVQVVTIRVWSDHQDDVSRLRVVEDEDAGGTG